MPVAFIFYHTRRGRHISGASYLSTGFPFNRFAWRPRESRLAQITQNKGNIFSMTKPNSKPKAPGHLRKSTQRWWLEVFETYELEIHHISLLTKACEAHDLGEAAREAIALHGLAFDSRFGPKARPEV